MIRDFRGEFGFLSNFYLSPVMVDGHMFLTVEHAFQAYKAKTQLDFDSVRSQSTPGKAKRVGRSIELRSDWEEIKDDIMLKAVRDKFTHNGALAVLLLRTNDVELVEGNTWHDNIWGDCSCSKCQNIVGENRLGKILMQVRAELRDEE